MKTGSVHAALSQRLSHHYLLGYVAAIVYDDGSEWLLTKAGHWASSRHDAPKDQQSHPWPTREQADAVARRVDSERFPAYTRGYVYSTPTPENAKGLVEITDDTDMVRRFVRPDCSRAKEWV